MAKRLEKDEHSNKDKSKLSNESQKLTQSGSSLTSKRMEKIIQRIKDKFYDKDDVLEEIAERMVQSNEWRDFLKKVRQKKDS